MSEWHVYMIRTADGSLYAGAATDVARRLAEHQDSPRGARYLRGRSPLELVYECRIGDRGLALKVERRLKRLSKSEKERLVRRAPAQADLIGALRIADD